MELRFFASGEKTCSNTILIKKTIEQGDAKAVFCFFASQTSICANIGGIYLSILPILEFL